MKKLLCILILCIIASCNDTTPDLSKSLIGKWKVVSINDKIVSEKSKALIEFKEDGKIGGNNGCNNFFGSFSLKDSNIKFGLMGSTKMLCHEEANLTEMTFNKAISTASTIEHKDDTIVIKSKEDVIEAKRVK
jgi:heat shock protein HslJ